MANIIVKAFLAFLKKIGRRLLLDRLLHALEAAIPRWRFGFANLGRGPYGHRLEIRVAGQVALYDLFPSSDGCYLCAIGHYERLSACDVTCLFASGATVTAKNVGDAPHEIEGQQVLILQFPVPEADRAAGRTCITLVHAGGTLLREWEVALEAARSDRPFVVTTLMQDEDRFLPEWIAYYRLLGADHFYIYDNRSLRRNRIRRLLAPLIKAGVVTLIDWDYPYVSGAADNSWRFCQRGQMHHCLYKYGGRSDWMLFIDVDEFIYPVCSENSLLPLLGQYVDDSTVAGLQFKMIWFGNSGHTEVLDGLVIENYTHRAPAVLPAGREKYAVKPKLVDTLFIHDVKQHADGTSILPVSPDQYRINHYFATSSKRRWRQSSDHNEVEDTGMARFMPALRDSLKLSQK